MIINYFKTDALDMLQNNIENNIGYYSEQNIWIKNFFVEKGIPNYALGSNIICPDIHLILGDSTQDAINAKILYSSLNQLNCVQAADLRLWGFLAHETFWEYMRERWPVEHVESNNEGVPESRIRRIKNRYFFGESRGKAYTRQGIARLWWSGYLTYDASNRNDPFEYTHMLFEKQDLFVAATERSLGRNKTLVLASLKVLKGQNLKRKQVRLFYEKLNQAGGLVVLDALDDKAALELCKRILDKAV